MPMDGARVQLVIWMPPLWLAAQVQAVKAAGRGEVADSADEAEPAHVREAGQHVRLAVVLEDCGGAGGARRG